MSALPPAAAAPRRRLSAASLWGLLGVSALLLSAVVRLAPFAREAVEAGLSVVQWAVLLAWMAFMAYAEGWRGFHRRFSPMVAARSFELARGPSALQALLAPMFCMGLIHATRRRLAVSWGVLLGIALLVAGVRQLPQPWRGIVDAGVVLGLAIGLASIGVWVLRGLAGAELASPELPDGA